MNMEIDVIPKLLESILNTERINWELMNEHELKQKDTIIKLVDLEIEENDHVKQIY